MIVGSKVTRVEATRGKDGPGKGLRVEINLKDIGGKGDDVEIKYEFAADYQEGLGRIVIEGELLDRADKKVADEARKMWKEKKDLPADYKLSLINSVNYIASAEGVLAAKMLRLAPPIAPPRIAKKA
ncbi:MAG: hypothetical protein PHQ80_00795 [Candidatus ainarchaeum sp.]|nr:hypothetical protein [Candidatus ainarchaeum sp.]MDD5096120.1 hypothetical protein [Candidatus ainarchaeum sp.]